MFLVFHHLSLLELLLVYLYKEEKKCKNFGKQTIRFDTPPTIVETASIVGPKEAQGPLARYFDKCLDDEFWGEKTWEKAESKIIRETVNMVLNKTNLASSDIDYLFAGDLLNQCISSSFGLRDMRNSVLWNFWCVFYLHRRHDAFQYLLGWKCWRAYRLCYF